jgi:hypothetical protein
VTPRQLTRQQVRSSRTGSQPPKVKGSIARPASSRTSAPRSRRGPRSRSRRGTFLGTSAGAS